MSSGILQNHFIEFTNDLLLLSGDTDIRSIYVRESYETVTALISDAMVKKKIRKFVVTGTPGIGKSIYLHYFLWLLFTRQTNINNNVDRKIYLQTDNLGIYSFRGDSTVSIDARVAKATVLRDLNCILLVDMVEENEPVVCAGTTIIFSFPNRKRYNQLLKGISRQYVLNCWTLEEVKAVWSHSYQHIPWEDVERIYNKMGGVIRYVLEQNDVADSAMARGESQARCSLLKLCEAIYFQTSDNAVMYRFVHLFSPDHTIDNATVVFASDYARRICLEGLNSEVRERVSKYITIE